MVVGEFTQETELLVIGGGPGGYAAAFRAAELGVQTTIVDPRPELGGVCLHTGCVPSKTLLHVADVIRAGRDAAQFGVEFGEPTIDPARARVWVEHVVDKLARGLDGRAKKLEIERIGGKAHFEDSKHVAIVGGAVPRVKFRRAIIATGARAVAHPELAFDGQRVLTPEEAVCLSDAPATMLVAGNGYQAVEIASIYTALGTAVTLATEESTLLPDADPDLVRPVRARLDRTLESVRLGEPVDAAFAASFDRVVVAVGQTPNTDDLNLGVTKVACDDAGYIVIDGRLTTREPRILAVGDVTGPPLLADLALAQGRIAGEVAAGRDSAFLARVVPRAIFTDPQVAWCGLTETQAKADGVTHAVSKIPWGYSGRAVGMGRSDGMTKIIHDPDTQIVLGVGVVGVGACELIAKGTLAIEMGAVLTDLAETIHPHPTVSELLSDAARE